MWLLRRIVRVLVAVAVGVTVLVGVLVAGAAEAGAGSDPATVEGALPSSRPSSGGPIVVAVVLGRSGTDAADALGPYEVFARSAKFSVYTVAATHAAARTNGGPYVVPSYDFADVSSGVARRPDLVVVPAVNDPTGETESELRGWLVQQARAGARILGVCAGSRVLAATGLLDGHRATSHWSRIGPLEQSNPGVDWVRGQRYVEDGKITTSAGVSSGIPASLHLVGELAGAAEAATVARQVGYPGWAPGASTAITVQSFSLDDLGVGLGFVLPWFRPVVAVGLADGVGEIDTAALIDVYSYASAARLVAVSTGSSVTTAHGVVMLTTPAASFEERAGRLVLPGARSAAGLAPALRVLADRQGLPVTALGADGRAGFDAALADLASSAGSGIAGSAAKMVDYPARPSADDAGGSLRTPVLFGLAIVLAVAVAMIPTAIRSFPPYSAGVTMNTATATATASRAGRGAEPIPPEPIETPRRGRTGAIVVASLVAGLLTGIALVVAPFVPARANVLTGVLLLGFAVGWALLATLSVWFGDRPQRWAAAPAAFFAAAGLIWLLPADSVVRHGFGWVWPPVLLGLVVWTVVQVRRHLAGRTRRWLVYPLLAVLALSSIGGGYQTVRESIDAAAHPVSGRLVDVGGRRVHLTCTGSGSPTVIVEPGLGEVSSGLALITADVARDTRVCVYDRPGRGWSDPVEGPQDAVTRARDLHILLNRAHVPGPYVLAGHSFGGLYVLSYAAAYPDQVAGLVLLDSTAPNRATVSPAPGASAELVERLATLLPAVAQLGVAHLFGDPYGGLPPAFHDEARAGVSTADAVASYVAEFREGGASIRQAAALHDLGGKPLVVVTAGRGHDETWRAAQDRLATLSTDSRHRVVAAATHASLILEKSGAAASGQAIREVVDAVRTSSPRAR